VQGRSVGCLQSPISFTGFSVRAWRGANRPDYKHEGPSDPSPSIPPHAHRDFPRSPKVARKLPHRPARNPLSGIDFYDRRKGPRPSLFHMGGFFPRSVRLPRRRVTQLCSGNPPRNIEKVFPSLLGPSSTFPTHFFFTDRELP